MLAAQASQPVPDFESALQGIRRGGAVSGFIGRMFGRGDVVWVGLSF